MSSFIDYNDYQSTMKIDYETTIGCLYSPDMEKIAKTARKMGENTINVKIWVPDVVSLAAVTGVE